MKKDCDLKNDKNQCFFVGDNNIHIGTEKKLDMIEAYVEAWIHKMYNYSRRPNVNYDGLIFIDAMCNSGYYVNQEENEIEGTSLRVGKKFTYYKENRYKDFSYEVILNDRDSNAIQCQKCHLEGLEATISIQYYNKNVKEFLADNMKYLSTIKNKHVLFFYDPFLADIYWEEISSLVRFCKESRDFGIDFIFTHFHQNDTLRGIKTAKRDVAVERYERTYEMSLVEIKELIEGKTGPELNEFFRNRIITIMTMRFDIDKENIAFAPVFNSMNQAVYDIVFYSGSIRAKILFKKSLYNQEKTDYKPTSQTKLMLFEDSYVEDRIDYREKDIFFSPYCYAMSIAKKFSSVQISLDDLKVYLNEHLYIPQEGAINEIKYNLAKYFNVPKPSKINNYILSFPKYQG